MSLEGTVPISGGYPLLWDHRIAYHVDGTRVLKYWPAIHSAPTSLTSAESRAMADEDPATGFADFHYTLGYLIFRFPEPMRISGFSLNLRLPSYVVSARWQASSDTTDGVDGSWAYVSDQLLPASGNAWDSWADAHYAHLRFAPMPLTGVVNLRLQTSFSNGYNTSATKGFPTLHLYGGPQSLGALRRLVLWDAVNDARVSADYLDWRSLQRGSTSYKQFRVKNVSATQTAQGVVVGSTALTPAVPVIGSQVQFASGGAYAPSLAVGDLAPGAVSPVVSVRYSVADDAQVGPHAVMFSALPSGWV